MLLITHAVSLSRLPQKKPGTSQETGHSSALKLPELVAGLLFPVAQGVFAGGTRHSRGAKKETKLIQNSATIIAKLSFLFPNFASTRCVIVAHLHV